MLLDALKKYDVILASGSPRRKELLAAMGIEFRVEVYPVEETVPPGLSPAEAATYLSRLKSTNFPEEKCTEHTLIITADTIVASGNELLEKSANAEEAAAMLRKLSGTKHEVITGVSLRIGNRIHDFRACTEVYFKTLTEAELQYYITRYHPFDKAGSYGIQEWIGHIGIQRIEGSYFNVMGLPTHQLYEELEHLISH
ncbi:MAG: septum formation protein Maf [Bacteroidales bacterium]|nr:septum formation protein Maf [Bacteroidales bacterium]